MTRFIYTFEFSLNFFPYRTTSLFLITVENMAKNKSKIIEKQRKTLQIVKRHKESELNITEYEGQDEEQLRAKIKELKHSAWTVHTNSSYEVILRRSFTDEEKKMSSTFRELIALYNIYSNEDILKKMQGKNVLHCTDNMAVSSILFNGSKKPHLLDLALKIFIKCRQFKVNLEVEWRPRNHYLLELADAGSKSFDDSSYSLNFESFSVVLEYFHDVPIHVDGMSENWNKKSNYYYSKKRDPFSSGVNFFAQSLDHNVNYYIFPPPSNIYQTIIHLAIHKAKGLLIVPHWPGSSFYLNIVPDGKHFSKWVIKFLKFRPTGFCYDVNIRSSTFKQSPSTFDMIILHFDFSIVNEFNFHHADVSRTKCIDHGCDKCS